MAYSERHHTPGKAISKAPAQPELLAVPANMLQNDMRQLFRSALAVVTLDPFL
jgi:hypothetical protein